MLAMVLFREKNSKLFDRMSHFNDVNIECEEEELIGSVKVDNQCYYDLSLIFHLRF